jgi:flavoprotein
MPSKANKLFKQKLENNKKQRNNKVSVAKSDQLLTIPITHNTVAKVRSHSIKVDEDEVIMEMNI